MSTSTTGLPPNAEVYVDALRAELADLAPEEREDLLSEVEPSLLEAAAEGDDPIAARLGPPADFAADLRASAGLPPAPPAGPPRPQQPRADLAETIRRLAAHPAATGTVAVARELAPLWWVARAYVAVALLALVTGQGAAQVAVFSRYPEVPRLGSHELGLLALAVALVASVAAGLAARRRRQPWRREAIALNVVLALCVIPVWAELADALGARTTFASATAFAQSEAEPAPAPSPASASAVAPGGLTLDGTPIRNIYPYDRAGRLLYDVRLYDDSGTPLDIGRGAIDPDRRTVTTADGQRVFNAFPIRYFEPGTVRVAEADAAPTLHDPGRITTPELDR